MNGQSNTEAHEITLLSVEGRLLRTRNHSRKALSLFEKHEIVCICSVPSQKFAETLFIRCGVSTLCDGLLRNCTTIERYTTKGRRPHWNSPTDYERKAFEVLRHKLVAPPILGRPKASRPYMIDTDTSAGQPVTMLVQCGRRYLEPTTSVATKMGTGRPSRHPRPPGDGGDSCRRRLGYEEPDAGQA